MEQFDYIRRNYDRIRESIAALNRAVRLVAVTKSGSDEQLLALASLGIEDVAENRPQELVRRAGLLAAAGHHPRMHEIGNLQTNKVKSILPICSLIHSVGSDHLAGEIEKRAAEAGIVMPVLMEINCAAESCKGGILPEDALPFAERMRALSHLRLCGVMTMGPVLEDPEDYRPLFASTRALYEKIGETVGYETDAPILSMGMSHSYIPAIKEGANLVRVGRAFFQKQ